MKKYFLLFVLVFLFNQSFAQDSYNTKCKELKHGIQFQIESLIDLTNFNGYTFSYRYLFNKNYGLRIGLYTNIYNDDFDIIQQVDSITNNPPNNSDNFNLKVSVQYLQSIVSYNDFDLIVGGGPFFSINNTEAYSEYLNSGYLRKYTYKNNVTGFGFDLILGVEYKLASNVVLSGEYGLTMLKETAEIEEKEVIEYETYNQVRSQSGDRDRFAIKGLGVNFGIAVFF